MSVLIVEDEPLVVKDLHGKLSNLGYNAILSVDNVEDALKLIETDVPEFVLVDIELNGDQDGIDLGRQLNQREIPFIYLSNLQDIGTFERAKKTHPATNIPKPVGLLQLRNSLLELGTRPSEPKKIISVSYNGKKHRIERKDVLFLKAAGNNCEIHTLKKREISSTPMNNVHEKLGEGFVRIHRSYVVNLDHVSHFEGNMIFLKECDEPLQMSETYRNDFMRRFDVV